jgi:O-antigen/teichoic acid export membrane protein
LSGLSFHYLNQSFSLSRRTTLQLAAVAIPAVTNLILCLLLIPRFGLDGAAWATTGSFAVGLLGSYTLMRRCLRLPVPWLVLGQAGLATAIMGLAVLQIPPVGGLLELVLKAVVGAVIYFVCVLTLDVAGMRTLGLGWLQARNLRPKEAA